MPTWRAAFGTQFPSIEAEREQLLRTPGIFHQEPWIEPLPRYQTVKPISKLTQDDVPALSDQARSDLIALASCGLVEDYELFSHQLQMLKRSSGGANAVVTAGTGSGKLRPFYSRSSHTWPKSPELGNRRLRLVPIEMTGGRMMFGKPLAARNLPRAEYHRDRTKAATPQFEGSFSIR